MFDGELKKLFGICPIQPSRPLSLCRTMTLYCLAAQHSWRLRIVGVHQVESILRRNHMEPLYKWQYYATLENAFTQIYC